MTHIVKNNNKVDDTEEENSNIKIFTKDGFKSLTGGIRTSNALPANTDWNFYKLNKSFCKIIDNEGNRILHLINSVMKNYDIEDNIHAGKSIEDKIELIIETNDTILEKVGDNLDELNGIGKKNIDPVEFQTVSVELPISGSWNRINKATFSVNSSASLPKQNITSSQSIHLLTGKNIIRPQTFFKDKIDNSNNYPWQPRIPEKPNSIRPLALFLEDTEYGEAFCHPYETELDQFEPLPDQLQFVTPINPKPIAETSLHIIESHEKLHELVEELRNHLIIGIDLEHHSYRTFMGITCVMQISTVDADYIIDTLILRDKLYVLNEIFTRRSIVKVFHGADSDILWLQRDLSLYIVNMFDTHQAAKQLGYSGLSLSYLLQRFCKFIPNKQFQLADWRIRPLPQQLINYAREDTHNLIYLYGVLKNELLKKANGKDNILKSVIQKSTEICKKRYFKPILNNESHLDFYRKCKRLFDNKQMYALKELYHWRDKIARQEDESIGYILPNHMLLQIAEVLPREMQGILACCNPIPPLVKSNLLELHQIVLKAREQSVIKPIMKEDNRSKGSTQQFSKINIESSLHCPHDLTKQSEFRDDLGVLFIQNAMTIDDWTAGSVDKVSNALEKNKSKCAVFNTAEDLNDDENISAVKTSNLKFLGPYERYKLVRPFIQEEEEKEAAKKEQTTNQIQKPSDKSTDDRIASLHEHFLKVAKECPKPYLERNQDEIVESSIIMFTDSVSSLTQTDGARKRKSEGDSVSLIDMQGAKKKKRTIKFTPFSPHPAYNTTSNPLHNTVPNFNQINNQNKKKPNKRKRKGKFNQKQEQGMMKSNHANNPIPEAQQTQQRGNNNRRQFRNRKRPKTNNNSSNNSMVPDLHLQSSSSFTPFDYSSVDYKQFQGGSSGNSNNKNKSFNTKFKGKNKKKGSKKNNKFSTFNKAKEMKI